MASRPCKVAFLNGCLFWGAFDAAVAQEQSSEAGLTPGSHVNGAAAPQSLEDLYLEIYINEYNHHKLVPFHRYSKNCLAVDAKDLSEFNIRTQQDIKFGDNLVCLESIPGVTYRYRDDDQSIHLTASDDARNALTIIAKSQEYLPPQQDRSLSGVVNYSLYMNFGAEDLKHYPAYQGGSASVDAHLFSAYGVVDQSFIASYTGPEGQADLLRLNSRIYFEDPETLTTYTAGDLVSGSLNWTRSIYMGGVQIRRHFGLRPDLVTMPIPQVGGSAAVPSTVELYVNQNRALSQEIAGGPFSVSSIPIASGPGAIRLALKDASGKETVKEYAYYVSPALLAPGLFDYSLEAGFARTYYGRYSNSYDENPIASGSFRYGLTPFLTVEGHGEGGAGLVNGGAGVNLGVWNYGVLSFAASGSEYGGQSGVQLSGSLDTTLWGARIYASSLRAFGDYRDLAFVTAPPVKYTQFAGLSGAAYVKQDQVSVSIPLGFDPSSVTLSYTGAEDATNKSYKLASLSYSRPFLFENSTFFISAFSDLERKDQYGAYAGVGFSVGKISASLSAQTDGGGQYSGGVSVSRSVAPEPGSFGYAVRANEGRVPVRSASVGYRAPAVQVAAGVQQIGQSAQVMAQADGAVAIMDGIHFANRIEDSFAVVETGIANVRVMQENRSVGETDANGRVLVPRMNAHAANTIRVDPLSLPVQAEMEITEQKITPASRGGTRVHFKGVATPASAIVVFREAKGAFLPASSEAWLNGGQTAFTIGYDGEAYITGLAETNTVLVKRPDGTPCNATFTFAAKSDGQSRVDNVVCQ